jgi:hypothetical protein
MEKRFKTFTEFKAKNQILEAKQNTNAALFFRPRPYCYKT